MRKRNPTGSGNVRSPSGAGTSVDTNRNNRVVTTTIWQNAVDKIITNMDTE